MTNRRRDWNAVTINKLWQLRSIRRNFLFPISAISHPAAAISHTQKINRSHDSLRAVLTQSAKVWTHRVRRPPFWLIVTALDPNCYLPVINIGLTSHRIYEINIWSVMLSMILFLVYVRGCWQSFTCSVRGCHVIHYDVTWIQILYVARRLLLGNSVKGCDKKIVRSSW